jgi:hypothetical protein
MIGKVQEARLSEVRWSMRLWTLRTLVLYQGRKDGSYNDWTLAWRRFRCSCEQLRVRSAREGPTVALRDGTGPGDLGWRTQQSCVLPSAELQYACRYWVDHLQRSEHQLCDDGRVHCFLREHLLHWVEALGCIEQISEGIRAIALLESMVNVSYVLSPSKYGN